MGDCFADDLAVVAAKALVGERDLAFAGGEERVVAADFYIFPRFNLGAALANDDHAGARRRAVSKLHPEVLRV